MSGRTTGCSSRCCGAPEPRRCGRSPGPRRHCRRAFTGETCSRRWRRAWRAASPSSLGRAAAATRFPDWPDDFAEIVYTDRYGNALTGLRGAALAPEARLAAAGQIVAPAPVFSAVPRGAAFWYVNSNGLAEIAVNGGRADRTLGLRIGTAVTVLG